MIGEHDATRRPFSEDDTPTEIFRPIRVRERRRARWTAGLAVVVVAVLAVSCYEVIAGLGQHPAQKLASVVARSTGAATTSTSAAVTSSPSASAPASPSASVSPAAAVALAPASVAAFGPSGLSDGDNPQLAARVLGGHGPWQSSWYATPQFGGLQHGTGLLIDMGRTVTVTEVRALLGKLSGGTLELRAGNTATLTNLGVVAGPADAGGTDTFTLTQPMRVRYLLLWFTSLAPDGAGHYQATVESIKVLGTS